MYNEEAAKMDLGQMHSDDDLVLNKCCSQYT